MRKTRRTLKLKRETVRQLATVELSQIAGGDGQAILRDTEAATCPWTRLAPSGACGG